MPKSAMIRARIEPGVKNKVEALLKKLGLNTTEVITLFYHQILLQDGVPFEVKLPQSKRRSLASKASTSALVRKARLMSPDERLEAFFNHSALINQIKPVPVKRK